MCTTYLRETFGISFGKGLFTAKNLPDMKEVLLSGMRQIVVVFAKDHLDLASQVEVLTAQLAEWRVRNPDLFAVLYSRFQADDNAFDGYIHWGSKSSSEMKQELHQFVEPVVSLPKRDWFQ